MGNNKHLSFIQRNIFISTHFQVHQLQYKQLAQPNSTNHLPFIFIRLESEIFNLFLQLLTTNQKSNSSPISTILPVSIVSHTKNTTLWTLRSEKWEVPYVTMEAVIEKTKRKQWYSGAVKAKTKYSIDLCLSWGWSSICEFLHHNHFITLSHQISY